MIRVFCMVACLASSALAQDEFEAETHWHADLSKSIFVAGSFDELDDQQRPKGWDDLAAFESGHATMFNGAGSVRLRPSADGTEVAFATTINVPEGVDYLTFYVRMRGPQMMRGKTRQAGGGVVFSLANVFGDTRTMPRLDPSYSGYRNWNEFMATTRVEPGETKLGVRVQHVDAKGGLEIDEIRVVPSKPGFQPTAEQKLAIRLALDNDDGETIANLLKEEPKLLELRTGERDNCTLLGLAVWKDAASVAKELIRAGADLEAVDYNWGNTPLGWACIQGRLEVAKVLIECGAEIDGYASLAQNAKFSGTWPHRSPQDFDAIVHAINERRTLEKQQEKHGDDSVNESARSIQR